MQTHEELGVFCLGRSHHLTPGKTAAESLLHDSGDPVDARYRTRERQVFNHQALSELVLLAWEAL